jgi:DNA topoisomerase I
MARLRRVDCSGPGIRRRRQGRGFAYVDEEGGQITDEEALGRIRELAIPPAWKDVWICSDPMGHIQATGMDARGRKQYRYHDGWRERRDRAKFEDMVDFARSLPQLRKRVTQDMRRRKLSRERILACSVRLLDRGFFRIGSEGYAEENETYGLATMRRKHVTIAGDTATFDYTAKGGQRRIQVITDRQVARLLAQLKEREGGGYELLAFRRNGDWRDVRSDDINEYVKDATGGDHSAKDFRTWNATLLAAVALAVAADENPPGTQAARERIKRRAVKDVARFLGNTPAVCRSSYIDPRVFDRFDGELTVGGVIDRLPDDPSEWPDVQATIERGVLDLLEGREDSRAVERIEPEND